MTLLLFPLKLELDLFLKHYSAVIAPECTKFQHTPVYHFKNLQLICAFSGLGKVQMALSAQALCQAFPQVKALICAGSAGALAAGLAAGDLVVGEFTIEHDFKVRSRNLAAPAFPADVNLLEKWRTISEVQNSLRIHFGKIASGDEDVITIQRRSELFQETQAQCVAWEGAGGARAAKFMKIPYLEIRAITDLGDEAESSTRVQFENQIEMSMFSLAQAMKLFVEN